MKTNTVIIQASSRSDGDTHTIVEYMRRHNSALEVITLHDKDIGHFDYEFRNSTDDFIPLMEEIIEKYDMILFATPVYWYSMSGLLKVFFDRISDLLKTHKALGRKLRGKKMAMVSVSNHNDLKEGFSMPFKESADYLGMYYLGDIHAWVDDDTIPEAVTKGLDTFIRKLS